MRYTNLLLPLPLPIHQLRRCTAVSVCKDKLWIIRAGSAGIHRGSYMRVGAVRAPGQ